MVYSLCYPPFNSIAKHDRTRSYYFCGISLPEYIIRVLIRSLVGAPFVITWLLFVYPSRVYMTEFYTNTWCGQWTGHMVLFFR